MGKYMRKSKTTVEIALMDVSHQSLGVRTRAKTLALQKLQKSLPAASGDSYLQLRSRRLEKPPTGDSKRQKHSAKTRCVPNPNPNPNPKPNPSPIPNSRESTRLRVASVNSGSVRSVNLGKKVTEDVKKEGIQLEINNSVDLGIEASFGENVLELEGRERSTRESTPCSLIRDPDSTIRTPGSSTRPTRRSVQNQNSIPRHIPTAHEMNEFFTGAEQRQQRQFVDKYNFDPVKDKPLPGRYEWVKLNP